MPDVFVVLLVKEEVNVWRGERPVSDWIFVDVGGSIGEQLAPGGIKDIWYIHNYLNIHEKLQNN